MKVTAMETTSIPPAVRPDMRAIAERDLTAQAEWLAQQADCRGYVDLDELFARAPNQYVLLAEMWRWSHPLPRVV